MKKIVVGFVLLLIALACKKQEERACWKWKGEEVQKTIHLPAFNQLIIEDRVEVELVQDTAHYVEIIAAKNEIGFIETKWSDSSLSLSNKNKCHWLRNAKKRPKLIVHFADLRRLEQWGSEKLSTRDTLILGELNIVFMEVSSAAHIQLKAERLKVNLEPGFSILNVFGEVENLTVRTKKDSKFFSEGLKVTNSLTFVSEGFSDSYVAAPSNQFKAQIRHSANLFYTGSSVEYNFEEFGSGRIIDNN